MAGTNEHEKALTMSMTNLCICLCGCRDRLHALQECLGTRWHVICLTCHRKTDWCETEEEARAVWNRRD